MSRIEIMFSWLKYRSNFISRSVRRQNMEWSNGVIFLIATFWPEGLWIAELRRVRQAAGRESNRLPDDTVGAFSDDILDLILIRNIERDLSGSSRWGALLSHDARFARLFEKLSLSAIVSIQDPREERKHRSETIHGDEPGNGERDQVGNTGTKDVRIGDSQFQSEWGEIKSSHTQARSQTVQKQTHPRESREKAYFRLRCRRIGLCSNSRGLALEVVEEVARSSRGYWQVRRPNRDRDRVWGGERSSVSGHVK